MFPGERITTLREDREITKAKLANDIHVSRSSVSEYEKGITQPSMAVLFELCDYFDVSLDYLMGRTSVKATYQKLEEKLATRSGPVPIDTIFKLDKEEKELVGLLLRTLDKNHNG